MTINCSWKNLYVEILAYISLRVKTFKRQPSKIVKLKQFVDKLPTNSLSVFDHFVGLALKGLTDQKKKNYLHMSGEGNLIFAVREAGRVISGRSVGKIIIIILFYGRHN